MTTYEGPINIARYHFRTDKKLKMRTHKTLSETDNIFALHSEHGEQSEITETVHPFNHSSAF